MKATMIAVEGAERMLILVRQVENGIWVRFADMQEGIVPFTALEVAAGTIEHLSLPSPFEIVLELVDGKTETIPWDFARHFADANYRERAAGVKQRSMQQLADRLSQIRHERGLTQGKLAQLSGVSRVTIARIETVQQAPGYDTLARLARGLNVSLAVLLTNSDGSTHPADP